MTYFARQLIYIFKERCNLTKGPAKVEPGEAVISIKIIDYTQKVKVLLNQQKEKSKCKDQNFLLNLDNEMKPNE